MKTSLIKSTFAVAAAFAAGSVLASRVETTTSTNAVYGATFESSTSADADVAPLNDFEYQAGDSITNYFHGATEGWFAGEGDASTIEANAGVTGAALKLSTEGQTLENKFSTTAATAINTAVAGAGAVFEAQVKFVASDTITDPFEGGTDANKFAIYAVAEDGANSTNLVVYHKYVNAEGTFYTNEVFSSVDIDTDNFTAVKVDVKSDNDNMVFQVSINGNAIESAVPYAVVGTDPETFKETVTYPLGSTWMMTAQGNVAGSSDLSALCFKGTGYVDDIAVSTLAESSTTYYTATFDDANGGIGYQEVVDGGTVTTNALADTVDYTFVEWTVGGSAATFPYEMHADTTFLATWTPKSSGGDTPVPADDGAFSVPATEANAIATAIGAVDAATALATDTGKGTTYGQAYALGLLTIDNGVATVADLPPATITFNADGEPVVTFENGMNPNTTDYVINYTLLKKTSLTGGWSGATTAAGPTTDPAALVDDDPGTAGFYKIKITISNK